MTTNEQLAAIAKELISNGITLEQAEDEFERTYLNAAIRKADSNITRAAKLLGVHRNTLHNKLRLLKSDDQIAHDRARALRRDLLARRRR